MHVEAKDMANPEDGLGLDPSTLDEDMHYRWGLESPQRSSRLVAKGYRPVLRSEDGVRTLVDSFRGEDEESADDFIRNGDMILWQKPKEDFEGTVRRRKQITESRLQSPEEQFKEKASKASGGLEKPIRVIGRDKED